MKSDEDEERNEELLQVNRKTNDALIYLLWFKLKKVKLNSKRVFAGQDGIKVGATANIEPSNSKGDCDTNGDGTCDRKILRLELSFFGSNQYVSGGCGHT